MPSEPVVMAWTWRGIMVKHSLCCVSWVVVPCWCMRTVGDGGTGRTDACSRPTEQSFPSPILHVHVIYGPDLVVHLHHAPQVPLDGGGRRVPALPVQRPAHQHDGAVDHVCIYVWIRRDRFKRAFYYYYY
jgi:hypothetical protein